MKNIIKKVELLIANATKTPFIIGVEIALNSLRQLNTIYEARLILEFEMIEEIRRKIKVCDILINSGKLSHEDDIEVYNAERNTFKFVLHELQNR